ncbi:MAG: tetratricopeptide repeat protein, partial [Anaerolineales bacterium]
MQALWDFLANNKDAIAAALAILGAVGGVLWAVLSFLTQRALKKQLKQSNNEIVDVITDPKDVLPKLLKSEKNNSELADHNIPYQQRNSEDTQGRIRSELNKRHYLLVTAPKGYGKTRETAMLAESLVRERYRVVRILGRWLDIPDRLPDKLEGDSSRIIIFLDDLNGLFRSKVEQSPRAEKIPLLNEKSYHDRLLDFLDWYEKRCGRDEIRVIATARSDDWEILEFDERDRLWGRFARVELNPPNINKVVEFIEREVKRIGLKSKQEDFEAIANKNDGSFRNLILNLETIQSENKELNKETFIPTEEGSWQENYERLLAEQPAIKYLYDAIDIARQSHIDLYTFIIEPLAVILWGGNRAQRILRRRKIKEALVFITEHKKFMPIKDLELAPRDGQVEVRTHIINWQNYAKELETLLFQQANNHKTLIHGSLLGFGAQLYYAGLFKQAENCWRKILEISPADFGSLSNVGVVLAEQKRYVEAEEAYRQAIAKNPDYAAAYSNLGLLLHKKLERYVEAEEAYRQAIAKNPDYAAAYSNLGLLL